MSATIQTPERTEQARRAKYFLPYQERWVQDASRFKMSEKARRTGFTFCESYDDVRDAIKTAKLPTWFSSADESAAREYILYCQQWAEVFEVVAEDLGEIVLDEKDDVRAYAIEFRNGSRIHALRSNPKAFRSKGGKVVLDEFAFHDDQHGLIAAARPAITWGYPIRILSTHNGKQCLYYRMLEDAKAGKTPWSVHTTDIYKAVEEGLADKILQRPLTDAERAAWIAEQRATCVTEEAWLQEFCCIPVDEATAFLTYDLIATVEDASAGLPALCGDGNIYVGMDLARRRDLTVIWVLEQVGDVVWTREVIPMKKASFAAQEAELARVLDCYPNTRRVCIDQTGMGEKFVEDVQRTYGTGRIEGVLFNPTVKQDLAFALKRKIEDKLIRVPKDPDVRDDFHAVQKITTVAGNVRFDAERTDRGHADRFFAAALAVHAIDSGQPAAFATSDSAWPERDRRVGGLVTARTGGLVGAGIGSARESWRARYGRFGLGSDGRGR